jgi:hypothetical protein
MTSEDAKGMKMTLKFVTVLGSAWLLNLLLIAHGVSTLVSTALICYLGAALVIYQGLIRR